MTPTSYKVFSLSQESIGRAIKHEDSLLLFFKRRYKYDHSRYTSTLQIFGESYSLGETIQSKKHAVGINLLPERKLDFLLNFLFGRRCFTIPLTDVDIPCCLNGAELPIANLKCYASHVANEYKVERRRGFKTAFTTEEPWHHLIYSSY